MNVSVGDILEMKKPHPCGCKRFSVLRIGMDFKIKCEKNIKKIVGSEQ